MYTVVMVGVLDKVDMVGFMVIVEEVEAGVEATLKAKLQQSYSKLPKMKPISSRMPCKMLHLMLVLPMDYSQACHHPFLFLIQIFLFLLLTRGSNKLLNIVIGLLERDYSHIQRERHQKCKKLVPLDM